MQTVLLPENLMNFQNFSLAPGTILDSFCAVRRSLMESAGCPVCGRRRTGGAELGEPNCYLSLSDGRGVGGVGMLKYPKEQCSLVDQRAETRSIKLQLRAKKEKKYLKKKGV